MILKTSALSARVCLLFRAAVLSGYGVAALFFAANSVGLLRIASAAAAPAPTAQGAVAAAADQGKADKEDKADGKEDKDDDDDDDDKDDKFPQPVRVGDLIGRSVIAPEESQNLLGYVRKLVRDKDGDLRIVMTYGGYFGFGSHLVCVSVDDVALTGYAIQAKEISAEDLDALPICTGAGDMPVDQNAIIKVNLAKPAH